MQGGWERRTGKRGAAPEQRCKFRSLANNALGCLRKAHRHGYFVLVPPAESTHASSIRTTSYAPFLLKPATRYVGTFTYRRYSVGMFQCISLLPEQRPP